MQGLAFGVFYAAMGLPLGWLADRTSRRGLIAVGAALWCAATAACGLASTFVQLFVARIAVGVGEAALSPAAMSIISDSFPKERRAVPIGVYAAAAAAGAGLALIVGGTVIQLVSSQGVIELPLFGAVARWQAAFVLVGIGGLVLLPLLATIMEPARRNESAIAVGAHADRSLHSRACGLHGSPLRRVSRSTRSLIYAVLSWVPTQFIRVYGWTAGATGLRYGTCCCCSAALAPCSGGVLAAKLGKRGVAQPAIWVTALGIAAAGPLLAAASWASDPWARSCGMRRHCCS